MSRIVSMVHENLFPWLISGLPHTGRAAVASKSCSPIHGLQFGRKFPYLIQSGGEMNLRLHIGAAKQGKEIPLE